MERGEHLKEVKAGLLGRLGPCDHIWVSSWVKVVLNLFHLQRTVTVSVKFVKCFIHKSLPERIKFSTQSRQKFVKANLAVTAGVEYIK